MRPDIIALARSWLGTPYRHQASLKGVGCDCLGLVRGVYAEAYGRPAEEPPPYSRDWAEATGRETMIEGAARYFSRIDPQDALPGDILIFRMRTGAIAKHCGILTETQFVAPGARGALADRNQTSVAHECLFGGQRLRADHCPLGRGPRVPQSETLLGAPRAPRSHACRSRADKSCLNGQKAGRMPGDQLKIIHAIEGVPVCEVHLSPWWRRRIAAAFRFPE